MKKFFLKNKILPPRFLLTQSWYDVVLTFHVGAMMRRVVNHPLITGSIVIFLGASLGNIFNFLFNLFMSRNLSFSDYGVLASLSSLMTLFALPVGAVIPMLVYFSAIHYAKGELDKVRGLYRRVTKTSFFVGVFIFVTFFIFSNQIADFFHIKENSYVVLVGLSTLIAFTSLANQPLLQAKLTFRFIAFLNSLSAFLKLMIGIVFVLLGYSVGGVIWALVASSLISYFLSFFPLRFLFSKGTIIPTISLRTMFFYGAPAALATFGLTSLFTLDIVLVKHFFSPEDAGIYAILSLIGRAIYYFSAPIASVMFPLVVQKHTRGEDYHNELKLSLFLVLLPSLGILLFYIFFPSFVVNIFSAKSISHSGIVLIIPFGIFATLYGLLSVLTNFYLSINKTKIFIPIIIGSVLQVFLIWIFHETFLQVILVSLGIAGLLLIVLLLYYLRLYGKRSKK